MLIEKQGNAGGDNGAFLGLSANQLAWETSTAIIGRWRLVLLAATLLGAIAVAFSVDCQLAQWFLAGRCPACLHDLFSVGGLFGHGLGVMLVVLVIHQLDRARRAALVQVLGCSLGAGLAADVVKLLIARTRPSNFDFHGGVWATFGDWAPFLSAGSAGQSFPSAHTATAVGFAMALAWLYPAGRKVFFALALLTACHRVHAGAHYLSDVLCGAAVGFVVARSFLGAHFSAWLDSRQSSPKTSTVHTPSVDKLPSTSMDSESERFRVESAA